MSLGLDYDSQAEQILCDGKPVEWYQVLLAAPHMSLNDLQAWEEMRQLRGTGPAIDELA